MKVRIASVEDIPEMHRIRTSVRENRLGDPAMVQPRDYRAMLEERGRGWAAEVQGRMVGFAIADRVTASVWALFVDPEMEGLGAGRRLHDVMMSWLFASEVERVWLDTDPGTRAERFYGAAGWRRVGPAHRGEVRHELTREEWLARGSPPAP